MKPRRTLAVTGPKNFVFSLEADDSRLVRLGVELFSRMPEGRPRPVVCVETGKTYESLSIAAREGLPGLKFGPQRIWDAIHKKGRAGGYHWQYAEIEEEITAQETL
eukprot:g62571.t1